MDSQLRNEDFAARAQVLAERAQASPPETWRPDKPELGHPNPLVGELVEVQRGSTSYRDNVAIAVLADTGGKRWGVWLLKQVLRDEFERQAPKIGELLAVSFEGRVAGGSGASGYDKFRLVVDRDQVEWGPPTASERVVDEPQPRPADVARHDAARAPPEPAPTQSGPLFCAMCGYRVPDHAPGCAEDIPF